MLEKQLSLGHPNIYCVRTKYHNRTTSLRRNTMLGWDLIGLQYICKRKLLKSRETLDCLFLAKWFIAITTDDKQINNIPKQRELFNLNHSFLLSDYDLWLLNIHFNYCIWIVWIIHMSKNLWTPLFHIFPSVFVLFFISCFTAWGMNVESRNNVMRFQLMWTMWMMKMLDKLKNIYFLWPDNAPTRPTRKQRSATKWTVFTRKCALRLKVKSAAWLTNSAVGRVKIWSASFRALPCSF